VVAARTQFATLEGQPVPAISVDEMREVDRVAVEETGPSLLQMMEHAGLELALAALSMLGARWVSARIVVLAGSGGNGGGGLCAARHLASRGADVLAVVGRPPSSATGAVGEQLRTLREAPARVIPWSDAFDIGEADLVIDAVIGYSLRDAPTGAPMALIRAAQAAAAPVLSLDIPSGVDPDTGEAPGVAVRPARTLTLALPKPGLRRENAGDLWLADLGIPPGVFARAGLAFASPFGPSSQIELRYPDEIES
jgi:NAD(P)H-hydrate epimerase